MAISFQPIDERHLQIVINRNTYAATWQEYYPDSQHWTPRVLVLSAGDTVEVRDYYADQGALVPVYKIPHDMQFSDPEALIQFCGQLLEQGRVSFP